MIDVSKYEKIGEYRSNYMIWFSPNKENIVYLIMFGDESYIGSSKNVRRRFSQYITTLKKGEYKAAKVQSAFNKHKRFEVFVLEYSAEDKLEEREYYYIRNLRPSLNAILTKQYGILNENIKKKIKELGFTTQQIAERLGISQQAVSQAINGNPSLSRLQEIAGAMGIHVSELLQDEVPNTLQGNIVSDEVHISVRKDIKKIVIERVE